MDDVLLKNIIYKAHEGIMEGKGKIWIHFHNGNLAKGELITPGEYRAWVIETYGLEESFVDKHYSVDPNQMVIHFKGVLYVPNAPEVPMSYWRVFFEDVQSYTFVTPGKGEEKPQSRGRQQSYLR